MKTSSRVRRLHIPWKHTPFYEYHKSWTRGWSLGSSMINQQSHTTTQKWFSRKHIKHTRNKHVSGRNSIGVVKEKGRSHKLMSQNLIFSRYHNKIHKILFPLIRVHNSHSSNHRRRRSSHLSQTMEWIINGFAVG